jgi:hypothetical protein
MSTRNLPGVKGRLAHKADNLTAICELIVWKIWEPQRLTTLWASMADYRDSFTFFFHHNTTTFCYIYSFIHLLKFHKILTRLRQPVDIEIVKKENHKLILLIKNKQWSKNRFIVNKIKIRTIRH